MISALLLRFVFFIAKTFRFVKIMSDSFHIVVVVIVAAILYV